MIFNSNIDIVFEPIPKNMNVHNSLTRILLFEKYKKSIAAQIDLLNNIFLELENGSLFIHKNYPDSVFYGKNSDKNTNIYLRLCKDSKKIFLKHSHFGISFLKTLFMEDEVLVKKGLIEYLMKLNGRQPYNAIDSNEYSIIFV